MYSIKDINARARFRPVEIDHICDNHEKEVIEAYSGKSVLLSDHNLHMEDFEGQPRILAADGRYFFGEISYCSQDDYGFIHRNGELHEHSLKYSDLSGLLVLDGNVRDDFSQRLRKLHKSEMVSETVKHIGNNVLVGINNEHMEESYVVGKIKDYSLPNVTFEVPLIGDEGLEKVELSLGVLSGMFVESE
ncbi:hypothetical protein GOV12_06390 [Candidatus Pacearchaeota archaeon]|nr:hypothetical protein [Candidatus Pacearchaeota archaeon]